MARQISSHLSLRLPSPTPSSPQSTYNSPLKLDVIPRDRTDSDSPITSSKSLFSSFNLRQRVRNRLSKKNGSKLDLLSASQSPTLPFSSDNPMYLSSDDEEGADDLCGVSGERTHFIQ